MYADDELPQRVGLVAIVDLRIQLLDIEVLLILEDGLKDLRSVLVEDVSAGPGDEYLGEQPECEDVLAVDLKVFLQVLSVLAEGLNRLLITALKVR